MKEKQKTTVFLLGDDHSIVRQGVQIIVEEIFEHAFFFHASTLHQVILKVKAHDIDIAILDAQFPDGNCISILPEIKQLVPDCKILIFTSYEEEKFALHFVEAGADGFLSKLSDESEIKQAISEIYAKGKYFSPLTKKLLSIKEYNPILLNPFNLLSEREMQIAELYAKGLGNLEIANALNVRQNTVSTFKKRIFEKLNITTLVELIELMKTYKDF
ncbi:MAG: response regulator transcription factor [Bacteroidales bacterium]|jgi:DNA-binding NarL/FixJ family response regulator|nr:response regulator transcription factor [Bacteroidales bacterium]MDD3701088.1 response regulator transcription factor [Bacteroidales bacterium]MDY0369274.1 response regulator transcription factor [Bacteroidales bacterium]